MPNCPYPGPPCYTENSQPNPIHPFQSNAIPILDKVTDIAWKRKYFNNPIVSTIPIEVVIWDANKSKPLAAFKQVGEKEPQKSKNPYPTTEHDDAKPIIDTLFYYELDNFNGIKKGMIVLYAFKEEKGDEYEFRIQVI